MPFFIEQCKDTSTLLDEISPSEDIEFCRTPYHASQSVRQNTSQYHERTVIWLIESTISGQLIPKLLISTVPRHPSCPSSFNMCKTSTHLQGHWHSWSRRMVEYRQVQIISGRSLLEDNCLVKSVFFGVGCFNMYGKHRKLLSFWPEYAEVIGKRTIEI